ncbi:major facilitator superfamily transporter [Pyrenophora seminiperda CCB06]|uniref:Major facilitator superfamily transporter n=1 Tax=Pyrenophora seminiperda CCB06 TaxID=1302712 RepID=A0A3M7LZZ4_9PLEO|nr:major facilitator superfamily transporter [Pyrenophora seminiperda CCB06]
MHAARANDRSRERTTLRDTCERILHHLTDHCRDLLKRHVANHATEPANKRQKREIARDARPCSRCRKKKIPCRVPDSAAGDENESHEIDAVHAAQDLLDLSNGFDYPSSLPSHAAGGANTTASTASKTPELFHHSMADSKNSNHHSSGLDGSEMSATGLNDMQPPPNASTVLPPMDQSYGDPTNSMAFFDNPVSQFDTTPGQNPFLPDYFLKMPLYDAFSGQETPRGIMDYSFDLDVGLTECDLGLLDQYNFQVPFAADTPSTDAHGVDQHPSETDTAPVRAEAYKLSIWRYLPQRSRNPNAEQVNLAFADTDRDRPSHIARRIVAEKLPRVSRDRLMALVLGTCSTENIKKIASAFPSIELLDGLIQYFLSSTSLESQLWFHLPTFSPSNLNPELLASIVSAGAASIPDVSLRKLGYALHEASRIGQSKTFEEDNTAIRDLQHLQTFLLQLKVGMWSGISRKMEIAESFLQPLMTMLRRGGRFRRLTWKEICPFPDEQGAALEQKWHSWVNQECWLRLVHRTFEFDRQSSMALLKPPLLSYAEMQLPLPSSNILWQAKSAAAWKSAYLNMSPTAMKRPSAIECLLNLEHLAQHDFASQIYLYMIWGTVWEYRQMCTLTTRSQAMSNNSLILSSRYQELTKQLEDFRVSSPPMNKTVEITLEIMLVHLNAPLDEIQLFAGLEGQEEARSAYLGLRDWTKTSSARQALWHAGQILRAAEVLSKALLNNFNAIAVYHAGLILWAYGFLKRSSSSESNHVVDSLVILNGDDSLSARKFITLDRGIPAIRSLGGASQGPTQLGDVCGVMDGLIRLLRAHHEAAEPSAPLVGNLVQLLEGLRNAINLSKDEVRDAKPPGTATLVERLSHTTHSQQEIRLVPPPTASPADPLNLPLWRKLATLACMSLHAFVVNVTSASISSALPVYASTPIFGLPPKRFSQLTYLIAVNVLLLGASNLWWVPLANTFGRRPVVLGSLLLLVGGSVWAGEAGSFGSLVAARVVMGIGGGPADAVSPEVVGEVFFVHQRGRALAIYTVFLSTGSTVGAVAGGYIVADMGLKWLHWINVILSAITFVLCLVLLPETLFHRPPPPVTTTTTTTPSLSSTEKPTTSTKENTVTISSGNPTSESYPSSYTYLQSLTLLTYHPGFLQKLLAPYKVLRLPGVWLVSGWYAGLVGLIVTMSSVGPQLVGAPPYLWGKNVGLINAGGIVGNLLGCVYTYAISDFTTKRLAARSSHGYTEPESRLVTALPALALATIGALIFGFVAQNPSETGWVGLQFGFGMVAFGIMQAPSVGFNYLIESYGALAGDCFVMVTSSRAVVSFAWTFFVGEWIAERGSAEPFGIFGLLMGVFGALTVPFLWWGKRGRIWTGEWVGRSQG